MNYERGAMRDFCIHTLDKDYCQTEMILNQSLQFNETWLKIFTD